jgi:hypothetical protein
MAQVASQARIENDTSLTVCHIPQLARVQLGKNSPLLEA